MNELWNNALNLPDKSSLIFKSIIVAAGSVSEYMLAPSKRAKWFFKFDLKKIQIHQFRQLYSILIAYFIFIYYTTNPFLKNNIKENLLFIVSDTKLSEKVLELLEQIVEVEFALMGNVIWREVTDILGAGSKEDPFQLYWFNIISGESYNAAMYNMKNKNTNRPINQEKSDITLLKDSDWRVIDGEFCRVIDFIPMASVKDGKVLAPDRTTPYASVHLECRNFPGQKVTGYIAHKLDFIHLWKALKERGVKPEEEVIIGWSTKYYNNWLYKILAFAMPRLWVMICHKGAFELISDPNSRPDLTGEARARAELPIIDWKPKVMQ